MEIFTLTNIGLGIVAFAWIYQFVRSSVIDKSFRNALIVYTAGLFLITLDSFISGEYLQGLLRFIAFAAVVGVLVVSSKKNNEGN